MRFYKDRILSRNNADKAVLHSKGFMANNTSALESAVKDAMWFSDPIIELVEVRSNEPEKPFFNRSNDNYRFYYPLSNKEIMDIRKRWKKQEEAALKEYRIKKEALQKK